MTVRLTVVGCAGSFPNADSPASCYLVEHDGFRLVVDMGNGALGSLLRVVDGREVDAVLISHLHTDHCIDLLSYDVFLRYHPGGPPEPVPVHGPAGTAERMAAASAEGRLLVLDFRVVEEGTFDVGPFRVTAARMAHPGVSYGYRIEAGGRSLVYSGDTGPTDDLTDLARGADLALFEASFREGDPNPPGLHMTGADAAATAVAAGVSRLVITHQVAWLEPGYAMAEAGAHPCVDSAYQGMVVEL